MDPFVQLMLSISLGFTMLAVALDLKPADFAFVRTHPRSVLFGSVVQLLGLPALTFALIWILSPPPGIALGMLIIASCPGGSVSNLLTRIGRGDTAYSVSLTMISTVFAGLLLPFTILFWTSLYRPTADLLNEIELDRVKFVISTAVTLILPLFAGVWVAHKYPVLAAKLNRVFLPTAIAILVILIVTGILTNRALIVDYAGTIFPIVILHNGLAFLLGYTSGKFALDARKTRALTFEVGIQNTGLGLIIVLAQFGGIGSAAVIVGTWSIWHIFAGFLLANIFRFREKKRLAAMISSEG